MEGRAYPRVNPAYRKIGERRIVLSHGRTNAASCEADGAGFWESFMYIDTRPHKDAGAAKPARPKQFLPSLLTNFLLLSQFHICSDNKIADFYEKINNFQST